MVVLSSAICTKNGKALLARQFVEMSRIRIEGLLAAFPKLLGSEGEKQHTYIETDTVRYIYQPIETLFLLLITNKASNIVEDLETLRLLSKLVPEVAGGVSEERVGDKCFELVFAFDEVITTGGYRENISLQQIKTNMEMDSHEEKLALMIKQSKMDSAKDQAARQAKAIKERQRELARDRLGSVGGRSQYQGIGGGGGGGDYGYEGAGVGGVAGTGMTPSFTPATGPPTIYTSSAPSETLRTETPKAVSKGMKLGAATTTTKATSMLDSLVQEDNLVNIAPAPSSTRKGPTTTTVDVPAPVMQHQPIQLVVEEKLIVRLTKDGLLDAFEVKGSLTLTATTEAAASSKVQLAVNDPVGSLIFQTHPKVNKQLYDQSKILMLKDASKGFPVGRPVGVLRWSYSSTNDESLLPLSINCWPEEEGQGKMNVNIEYEWSASQRELHNVEISIPLGTAEVPQIASIDGEYRHDAREHRLVWHMDLIDASNASGSLEFTIAGREPSVFFPINVSFTSPSLYADVNVVSVTGLEDSAAPIPYSISKGLSPDSYYIG